MNATREQILEAMKGKAFWKEKKTKEFKKEIEKMKQEIGIILGNKSEEIAKKTVTVKELFGSVTFYDVMAEIRRFGVEVDEEYEKQYKDVFEKVKKKETKEQKSFINLEFEEGSTPDVYSMEYEKGINYSFSLVPFSELANYKVFYPVFDKKSKLEVAAGILEEFMWASDDDYKEEMKEELAGAVEEVEKYNEVKKAEEQGVSSIFQNEIISKPFILSDPRKEEIGEGETIRDYFKEVKLEGVKRAIKEHYEVNGYDDSMKLTAEETYQFIASKLFVVKKKVNETPKEEKGYVIEFKAQNNVIEVEKEDKEYDCLYCGAYCFELLDEKVRRKRFFIERTKEEIVLLFLIALYRDELSVYDGEVDENKEDVERINSIIARNEVLEKAKGGFETLTHEELIDISRSLENIM